MARRGRGTDRRSGSLRIAIIGGGPAGLCMGIRLVRAGFRDFTIFESAEEIGGTWWHNRYPGAGVDTKVPFYAYSFVPKPDWSRSYAPQPEILAYLRACAARYGLRSHVRLSTTVARASWDEGRRLWELETDAGDRVDAEVLVSAVGMLNVPKLPDIPGRHCFTGPSFHSARWPDGFVAAGRRVAVIGSGATAAQLVPALAEQGAEVTLYQRSPGWVMPKIDAVLSSRRKWWNRRLPILVRMARVSAFLSHPSTLRAKAVVAGTTSLQQVSQAHIERWVRDPALRAAVTPDYPFGCKRLLISTDYLRALSEPNVRLVTDPIACVTPTGIRTATGEEVGADAIVYATGFHADDYLRTVEVVGRGGVKLHELWADGAEAYLGIAVPSFPNLFMLWGPNTAVGSILFMIEQSAGHVLRLLRIMRTGQVRVFEVEPERSRRYNRKLQRRLSSSVYLHCSNYFRSPSGKVTTLYPFSPLRYWLDTRLGGPWSYTRR